MYQEIIASEYDKILHFIKSSDEGISLNLRDALEANKKLFSTLKIVLDKGSEEEKREVEVIFKQIYLFFMEEAKKTSRNFVTSENDLFTIMNNPQFFTPNQWNAIQKVRLQKESKM